MNRSSNLASALALIAALAPACVAAAPADGQKVDFVKDVQPIFEAWCVKCHRVDPKNPKGAGYLLLTNNTDALHGGKNGVDIVPGNSKQSRLFKLFSGPFTVNVNGSIKAHMPKAKKGEKWKSLPADQIEIIRRWIDQGADWPDAKK
jgi:hypothetical protein